MCVRWLARTALWASFAVSAGCSETFQVRVDLRTDFVPLAEFSAVEVVLATSSGETLREVTRPVMDADDFDRGVPVFDPDGVEEGAYLLIITLVAESGAAVVRRTVATSVSQNVGFTVLITRSARLCDPNSCDPNETCGLGSGCIDRECSELNRERCPEMAECGESGECVGMADCAEAVCVERYCFYRDRGICDDATQWCSPEEGCREQGGVPVDAGLADAGMMDAGIDVGVEDSGFDTGIDTGGDTAVDAEIDATSDAEVDIGFDTVGWEVGACGFGLDDCDDNGSCETGTVDDPMNCGGCRMRCDSAPNAQPACEIAQCTIACDDGYRDCDESMATGCETNVMDSADHCGACDAPCPATFPVCLAGQCVANPFPSDGSEGPFEPTSNVTLSAGVHQFTTVHIPMGVTVRVDGTGVLELYATDDVLIEGSINLSGGRGATGGLGTLNRGNGGGGHTGTGVGGDNSTGCNPGGLGGLGWAGEDTRPGCLQGGRSGGGAGTYRADSTDGGGGGGGPAGGGGASQGTGSVGGNGGAALTATAGRGGAQDGGPNEGGGGEPGQGAYSGDDGAMLPNGIGGGGGSIGLPAILDLAVTDTFYPGSGGGGAAATTWASGGGGGGGALRISSSTRITVTVTGSVTANGGQGGTRMGVGGAGSGGVVYLVAPAMMLQGAVLAAGGAPQAENGSTEPLSGGGGLGRVRLSTLEERCSVQGATLTPPLMNGCAIANEREFTYVGRYPD